MYTNNFWKISWFTANLWTFCNMQSQQSQTLPPIPCTRHVHPPTCLVSPFHSVQNLSSLLSTSRLGTWKWKGVPHPVHCSVCGGRTGEKRSQSVWDRISGYEDWTFENLGSPCQPCVSPCWPCVTLLLGLSPCLKMVCCTYITVCWCVESYLCFCITFSPTYAHIMKCIRRHQARKHMFHTTHCTLQNTNKHCEIC